jgi:hypothetical protein
MSYDGPPDSSPWPARLLGELPANDPRLLDRRAGRAALFSVAGHPVAISVCVRQFPGLAKPEGDAAAASAALNRLEEIDAAPLALVQSHRIGDAESPGMEGRARALRASSLAQEALACGGTVWVDPAFDALIHTHAFGLGLRRHPFAGEWQGEEDALWDPLPEGEAPTLTEPGAFPKRPLEEALREVLCRPSLGDPAPLCGSTPTGRAALLPLPGARTSVALACADAAATGVQDPYWAAAGAVAEAALRVACTGAEPLAIAVALALGSSGPAQAWALNQSLAGLRQASLALELPVVVLDACEPSVASDACPLASPVVAVLGSIEDHAGPLDLALADAKGLTSPGLRSCGDVWRAPFEALYVLGEAAEEAHLDEALRLQQALREGINLGLVRSAREIARGGIWGAVAVGGLASGMAAQLFLPGQDEAALFREASGRALISVSVEAESALRTLCGTHRVVCTKIGVTGGTRFSLALEGRQIGDVDLGDLAELRSNPWGPWLG